MANRPLKVYGCNLDGRHRGIVAATSQVVAAKLLGLTLSHLRTYGCETGNKEEVELAMREPGIAWQCVDRVSSQWSRIEKAHD
ncbi:hypothetical protein [Nevskia sp.]|uniref:hypothetical protein n=1 Tax=Nevskia sp. TaxID=1929292 RepID=UPI0025DF9800|nr:hypothetical protein [Nevskia sp.]